MLFRFHNQRTECGHFVGSAIKTNFCEPKFIEKSISKFHLSILYRHHSTSKFHFRIFGRWGVVKISYSFVETIVTWYEICMNFFGDDWLRCRVFSTDERISSALRSSDLSTLGANTISCISRINSSYSEGAESKKYDTYFNADPILKQAYMYTSLYMYNPSKITYFSKKANPQRLRTVPTQIAPTAYSIFLRASNGIWHRSILNLQLLLVGINFGNWL